MVSVLSIIAIAVGIFLMEAPSLRKHRYIKELCFFSVLLLLGTGFTLVWALHIPIPSPLEWLENLYKPLDHYVMRFLK